MTQPVTALAPPDKPVPAPAGYDRDAKLRAGAHDLLDLMLGPRPHGGGGLARRRPLGVVVGEGAQHVLVGDQAAAGSLRPSASTTISGMVAVSRQSAPVISAGSDRRAPVVMIEAAWSAPAPAGRSPASRAQP